MVPVCSRETLARITLLYSPGYGGWTDRSAACVVPVCSRAGVPAAGTAPVCSRGRLARMVPVCDGEVGTPAAAIVPVCSRDKLARMTPVCDGEVGTPGG